MAFFELIFFLFLTFLALLFFVFCGKLIAPLFTKYIEKKPFHNFFMEALFGLIAVITIYSCICTVFTTVNVVFFIWAGLVIYVNGINPAYADEVKKRLNDFSVKILLYAFIISILVMCCSVVFPLSLNIDSDMIYYAEVSNNLSISGRENVYHYFNFFIPDIEGTSPYHYFELWVGNIFIRTTELFFPHIIILQYGSLVFFKILVCIGVLSLIENIRQVKIYDLFIVVLLTFFNFSSMTEIGNNSWDIKTNMWGRPAFTIYMMFLIPFLHFLINRQIALAFYYLLCLPICSIVTAPAVFAFSAAFVVLYSLRIKNISKDALNIFIGSICIGVAIFLFYKFSGIKNELIAAGDSGIMDIIRYDLTIWKAIVFFLVTLPLRALSIIALPLLLILFVSFKKGMNVIKQNALAIFCVVLFVFCGIILFQCIPYFDNAYQLPFVAYTSLHLLFIWLFYLLITEASYTAFKKVISGIFSILMIYFFFRVSKFDYPEKTLEFSGLMRKGYSENYIKQLQKFFEGNDSLKVGGFLYDAKDLTTLYDGQRFSLVYQLGSYIVCFNSDVMLLPLTPPQVLHEGILNKTFYDKVLNFDNMMPYYKNYNIQDEETSLKNFITENHISFLVASKNFDINKIRNLDIRKSFSDLASGDQIIILNSSK
ncbi:MAG: hypothetical protein HY841_07290 [Bacteroidetes bacterium]|nr:hypothetical protein [Bacteroidota bacterium]